VTNAYHGFESTVDLSSDQLFNFFLFLVLMMIIVRRIGISPVTVGFRRQVL
jgi:hypothetical protein